jgi:cyclopropane fatty-acyl-phospholipid synthase-like methyltransferase
MRAVPLFEFVSGVGCPACAGYEFEKLHQTLCPNHPGPFYRVECVQCGLLLNSPRLHDPSVLYASTYYVFGETEEARQRTAFTQLRWVRELCGEDLVGRRILEVGPALGHLAHLLTREGADVRAVELSEHAAAESRERFGLDVVCGSLEEIAASTPEAAFDVIIAFEIIEHVTAPAQFLEVCRQLLRPGGKLCLSTPNAAAEGRFRRASAWGGFNPFHVVLLTPSAADRLFEQAGFRDLQLESTAASDRSTALSRLPERLRRLTVDTLDTLLLGTVARALRDLLRPRPADPTPIEDIALDEGLAIHRVDFTTEHLRGDTLRISARR